MKFKILACLTAACCLLAGCEKKGSDPQDNPTNKTEQSATEPEQTAEATTEIPEETKADTKKNEGIPDTAVVKVTKTTYRDCKVWETVFTYRNDHGDGVAVSYLKSDGTEEFGLYTEYEYDENGKTVYEKDIFDSGSTIEAVHLSDNTVKTKSYDEESRLEGEGESVYDEYGNCLKSRNVVYGENGEVIFEMSEDNSDCDYDENGNILVCRQRSESGEIISTTTNTYDEKGNLLRSEELSADSEKYGYYSKVHSYKYDNDNNLIFEEEIGKSDADTVYRTEKYEYQYDGDGRKIREDHTYINTDYDTDLTEYTLYEYIEL